LRAAAFRSWGGLTADQAEALSPDDWRSSTGPVLPFGNGRSYGDSCLLDRGGSIATQRSAHIHALDPGTGELIADSGLLIADLIAAALPLGWFVPVTPGTRFVTLGGAIANDVHGKNHHGAGTFGRHVLWFELERSDQATCRCSLSENAELFRATIGGLGLTGLIRRIGLQLLPVTSGLIDQETLPFENLDSFFQLARQSDQTHAYSVAWIDSLATGSSLGRGVYFRGNHADTGGLSVDAGATRLSVPFTPPFSLLNRTSLSIFNRAYRFAHRRPARACVPYGPFFYPLDRIGQWNRIYGPGGLRQFQCVVPMAGARKTIAALLEQAQRARAASFLTVLKLFGDLPSPGLMSFPMAGATLTLDFAYHGETTDRLLAQLDAITLAAGGRINPYKDARMPAEVFRASFPQMDAFKAIVDPRFTSRLWQRVSG
jgi:FAD/FMN-containing dehydrogenase